ncbi:MAG: 16S/23S rRNA (cytidine-2'-O)-methyltransferase TlyA [Chroococcopsis gigantea SAG 12.99]|jgi:23S rRNA (cytidine1920-2'-O)/16S rRNA (cytidine1409-2'-O)-methyltransferase|nr:TlyA family RNA methyltransferase [Chlorogloea purpurea SAG 13.99]MDV3002202.1 16S/23S rRNA (cytidine-2'-O)-methyltransferase TlyA [Chroococcopsis gigantea SAG 12.99]
MTKQRLDALLIQLNLCDSRQQAQRLIRAGEVKVNRQIVDKPGTEIDTAADITIDQKPPFVSRGGEKLAKALHIFGVEVRDRICLDGGISTGGFTDCLLQKGAKKVYGVDVGYGQVAWTLRQDERVVLKERTNFRYLTAEDLYEGGERADLGVMDLSFISLTKVLQPLKNLLIAPREVILLVKPQFEVGRVKVGKKGVVKDTKAQAGAIFQVLATGQGLGWYYGGLIPSPIRGPAGNVEYLLRLQTIEGEASPDLPAIEDLTARSMLEIL